MLYSIGFQMHHPHIWLFLTISFKPPVQIFHWLSQSKFVLDWTNNSDHALVKFIWFKQPVKFNSLIQGCCMWQDLHTHLAIGMSCMSGALRQNPCQHGEEHANPLRKASRLNWNSNQEFSCCESTVIPTEPLCHSMKYISMWNVTHHKYSQSFLT